MTKYNSLDTAQRLRTRSPERLWGVSAASIYTAVAARLPQRDQSTTLASHVRAETLRTNNERAHKDVVELHDWLVEALHLTDNGEPTLLGSLVLTSANPESLVRAVLIARFDATERILRSCLGVEETFLPNREFESLMADDWERGVLAPLLGSLDFVSIYQDSVEPHVEQIKPALEAQRRLGREQVVSEAQRRVLPHLTGIEEQLCLDVLTERLTGTLPQGRHSPEALAAALVESPRQLPATNELGGEIDAQRKEYEQEFETLRSLLAPTVDNELSQVDVDGPVGTDDIAADIELQQVDQELLLDVVATVSAHPEFAVLDLEFLTTRLDVAPYPLYQALSSITGVDCAVSNEIIEFSAVPETVDGANRHEEYTTHLIERCATIKQRIDSLAEATVQSPPAVAAEQVVARDYESLSDGDVAPAYFTYTLVNPEALGDKEMDEYVGESRGLRKERARLRRWHDSRPAGMHSYTSMTDRLFSCGLEREFNGKILRIMTPFDDDTFTEYVSQIRRLLEHEFELRLLTRHTKSPWEWRRLQRNLLGEIKNHRDQITVRTYSRFKNHQRITPDMDFHNLGEFGVHGKLQTIGQPEEGAALLGSANFMQNSYDWNPECGVYTERTQFVEAAIKFFDIVWDISESDELSIERLQEVPDHKLVPTYYS
jgi:hypothetical protein